MPDSLYEAMLPVTVLSQLFGQSVFEHPEGRLRPVLSIAYVLAWWIIYSCIGFYYATNYPSYVLFQSSVALSLDATHMIAAVIATLAGFSYSQNLHGCIRSLTAVDETLETLGAPAEYSATFKYNLRLVTVWVAIVVVLILMDVIWMWAIVSDHIDLILWLPFLNSTFHTNSMVYIHLGTILRCIEGRFERLNGCIEKLSEGGGWFRPGCRPAKLQVTFVRRDPHRDETINRVIWVVMHLHLELRRISHELNKVFQMQMSFHMACCFYLETGLVVMMYNIVRLETEKSLPTIYYMVITAAWFAFFLVKLVLINIAFENVCSKETATMRIFHKLINSMRDSNERKEVIQFALQMMHNPLKFTGLGLFCFGYNFIQKFCASMTTVFVILLQTDANKFVYTYTIGSWQTG